MEIYTRKSEVTLADGVAYSFYAIPYGRNLIKIIKAFKGNTDRSEIFITVFEEIEKSLLFTYSQAEVDAIFDKGLIPSPDSIEIEDETGEIARRVLSALIVQFSFEKTNV